MTPRTEELFLISTGATALGLLAVGWLLRHYNRKGTGS